MDGDEIKDKELAARQFAYEMKQNFEQNVEMIAAISKLMFARYETLISAGFTKEQAIDIIKARGMS
jgi:hypothetical protein